MSAQSQPHLVHPPHPRLDTLVDADCPALARLGISACGLRRSQAGAAPRYQLGLARMTIGISGPGRVLIDGHWQSLPPGQVYATAPGIPHVHAAEGPGSIAWLLWSPGRGVPTRGGATRFIPGGEGMASAISGLLQAVDAGDQVAIDAWARLAAGRARGLLQEPDQRLIRLWATVLEDLAMPWDLERMAQVAGICSEQLRRLSHEQQGASPMDLLTRVRMQRAGTLLLDPGAKLSEVARQVGYGNQFNFSTAFKRIMGCSPSAWRRVSGNPAVEPADLPAPGTGRYLRSG